MKFSITLGAMLIKMCIALPELVFNTGYRFGINGIFKPIFQ